MSATAIHDTVIGGAAQRAIPFGRLLRAEFRKFRGTRSVQVFIPVMILIAIAAQAASAWFGGPRVGTTIVITGAILSVSLPVLGILAVTTEWQDRTIGRTFSLEPRRLRVVLAQGLSAIIAALGICVFLIVTAPIATAVVAAIAGAPVDWAVAPERVAGWVLVNLLVTASGVAVGALLLHATAAITIVVGVAVMWPFTILAGDIGIAIRSWLDLVTATAFLISGTAIGAEDAARLAVSVGVWIVGPALLAAWRITRREV